jgi:hypothetical protein
MTEFTAGGEPFSGYLELRKPLRKTYPHSNRILIENPVPVLSLNNAAEKTSHLQDGLVWIPNGVGKVAILDSNIFVLFSCFGY